MENIRSTISFIVNGTTNWDRGKTAELPLHALADLFQHGRNTAERHHNIFEPHENTLLLASGDYRTVRNIVGAALIAYPVEAPVLLEELLRRLIKKCDPRVTNAARLGVLLAVLHAMSKLFFSFLDMEHEESRHRIEDKVIAFLVTFLSHEAVRFIPKAVAEAGAISDAVANFVSFPLCAANAGEWFPRVRECARRIIVGVGPAREVFAPDCRLVDQVINELNHKL